MFEVRNLFAIAALAVFLAPVSVQAGETPAPEGAKVYFINLKDGDTVSDPVKIQFGLSGMGVAPAGVKDKKNTGHHHLLIDATPGGAKRSTSRSRPTTSTAISAAARRKRASTCRPAPTPCNSFSAIGAIFPTTHR